MYGSIIKFVRRIIRHQPDLQSASASRRDLLAKPKVPFKRHFAARHLTGESGASGWFGTAVLIAHVGEHQPLHV